MDTKTIEVEIYGELLNVVLEENGEDKMLRESNLERIGENKTL